MLVVYIAHFLFLYLLLSGSHTHHVLLLMLIVLVMRVGFYHTYTLPPPPPPPQPLYGIYDQVGMMKTGSNYTHHTRQSTFPGKRLYSPLPQSKAILISLQDLHPSLPHKIHRDLPFLLICLVKVEFHLIPPFTVSADNDEPYLSCCVTSLCCTSQGCKRIHWGVKQHIGCKTTHWGENHSQLTTMPDT